MQLPHQLRRLDVHRALVAEGPLLHAQNEAEGFDMAGQITQGETNFLALVEIESSKVWKSLSRM